MLGGGGSNSQKPNRPGRRRNRFALSFDGSNDYVDTGLTHQATFRSNFSVGFWIKPDDGQPDANDYAIGGIESGNTDGLLFQIGTNGKITVQFKSNNDPLSIRSDAAVFSNGAASSWMHILVVVADANTSTKIENDLDTTSGGASDTLRASTFSVSNITVIPTAMAGVTTAGGVSYKSYSIAGSIKVITMGEENLVVQLRLNNFLSELAAV